MNLLFVTPSDKVGGGNRVMFELAARLSRRHRVACAFPRSPGRPKHGIAPGIRTVAAGFGSGLRLSIFPNLLSLYGWLSANKAGFDAIVSTGQVTGILLPGIRHRRLFNFIQSDEFAIFEQGHLQGRPLLLRAYRRLMGRSLRSPGIRYLFNSSFTHRVFTTIRPGRAAPALIVHPGVDHAVFNPSGRRRREGKPVVCSLARGHALKGLDVLLKAYECAPPGAREKASWRLLTNDRLEGFRLPRGFAVHRPQNDSELAEHYRQTDIFLSTSLWEGFGLPALEAMACGCAVVTSRNGGCDEYADHGRNCLVYGPADHSALAGHIRRLIADPRLGSRLAAGGIESSRRFTWEASAERLEALLGEAL